MTEPGTNARAPLLLSYLNAPTPLSLFRQRHCDFKDTFVEPRIDLVFVDIVGKGDAAREGTVTAFAAVVPIFTAVFVRLPAFARDGQNSVFDVDVHIVR